MADLAVCLPDVGRPGRGCFSPRSESGGTDAHYGGLALGAPITAGVVVLLVAMGLTNSRTRQAAVLGVAAGTGFGLTAALMKTANLAYDSGVTALLTSWEPYLMVAAGPVTLYLFARAVQAGALWATQPGVTMVDPLVATVLGLALFGDRIRTGPYLVPEAVAAVAIVVATFVLSSIR